MPPRVNSGRNQTRMPLGGCRHAAGQTSLDAATGPAEEKSNGGSDVAHVNRVLRSINDRGADRCVDVFLRPDGTVGFEEFRRDVEDARGWFPIGGHRDRTFADEAEALAAARTAVVWLASVL